MTLALKADHLVRFLRGREKTPCLVDWFKYIIESTSHLKCSHFFSSAATLTHWHAGMYLLLWDFCKIGTCCGLPSWGLFYLTNFFHLPGSIFYLSSWQYGQSSGFRNDLRVHVWLCVSCACVGQVPWLLRGFISFLINWKQQQHAHPGDAVRIEWHDTQQT